ncbi:CBS domain-containing protein [Myroides marinus]|uniref:CBS domain-containing protein n=1 Tax=Myroides marinus TaxID=703342 RepID=UPI00257702A3|nr:CBS domain-containing protein [Myroides marinus]MDM1367241.1 CBS domain-containing protein [Myroides marinus]MDM1374469.1 CBS domain-containing protein [Myroides marinus]MDM1381624.1 CBS domain-containing protein [Myroides marinus]
MLSPDFFLLTDYPVCKLNTLVKDILPLLEKSNYLHIPVVNMDEIWIGNINTEDIYTADEESSIQDVMYDLDKFYLLESSNLNPFDFFDLFSQCDTNMIPLLDEEGRIKGVYNREYLLNEWSKTLFFEERGTTFVIEKGYEDYSFSEISQIIESNNAKVIGLMLLSNNNYRAQMLVKTNSVNTKTILDDLRRYGYDIVSTLSEDTHINDLKERTEYLNKYLNI